MRTMDGSEIESASVEWSGTVELFVVWPESQPRYVQMTPDQARALASELVAAAINAENEKRVICTSADVAQTTGRGLVWGVRPEFAEYGEFGRADDLGSIDAIGVIPAGSAVLSHDERSVHTSWVAR